METTAAKKKILIVDDEKELSNLFKTSLEAEGFEVQYCGDGESALQVARNFKPDFILLDLMMPKMNGMEVCSRVKKQPKPITRPTAGLRM